MGKEKYVKKAEKLFEKSQIVNIDSISRLVKDKKKDNQYSKQLIRNLIRQKKIKRITNGFYTIHDDPSLAVLCFKPAYLGLQDSLSFHELWEQETIPIIITSKKIRQGMRKVFGMNVLVRRINKKYLFGFDYAKQGRSYFPYSNIEKTFIDMIYFKENINEKTGKNLVKKIDKKKLNSYLKHYPKSFRKKVLNLYGFYICNA